MLLRNGQMDMDRSICLVMPIKNTYALWGRKRLPYCVANFWLKSLYPLLGYEIGGAGRFLALWTFVGVKVSVTHCLRWRIDMLNPNFLAFIVSEISAFIRTDGQI